MYKRQQVQEDFDKAAQCYDSHASLQQYVQLQLMARLPRLKADAQILDAGCGTGAFARHMKLPNIIALDHAFGMCALARSNALPVTADMTELPFANNQFDCVFSSLALQWVENWQSTVNEWLRVLKPAGFLAFSTFGTGTLHELAESFKVIDNHTHVSEFISADDIWKHYEAQIESETITEYYPDIIALSRHLKALGARNKHRNARHGLTTPRQLQQVQEYYEKTHNTKHGLKVSWNVLYVTIQKLYSKQFENWLGSRGEVRGVYSLVHEHTETEG